MHALFYVSAAVSIGYVFYTNFSISGRCMPMCLCTTVCWMPHTFY